MIYAEKNQIKIIREILIKYPYTFYVFGSRSKGTEKRFSDLDLCFFEDIPWNVRAHIDEDFEESDLPFTVDVVDWNMCDKNFKKIIRKDFVCLQKGEHFDEASLDL